MIVLADMLTKSHPVCKSEKFIPALGLNHVHIQVLSQEYSANIIGIIGIEVEPYIFLWFCQSTSFHTLISPN